MTTPLPKMVTFQDITRILVVTDALSLDRELIEIPLTPESPGRIRKLSNGKIEIIVDADLPFDQWLDALHSKLSAMIGHADG